MENEDKWRVFRWWQDRQGNRNNRITCFALPSPSGSAPMHDSQCQRLVNNLPWWYLFAVKKVLRHRRIWRLQWSTGFHQPSQWTDRSGSASSCTGHGMGLGNCVLMNTPRGVRASQWLYHDRPDWSFAWGLHCDRATIKTSRNSKAHRKDGLELW